MWVLYEHINNSSIFKYSEEFNCYKPFGFVILLVSVSVNAIDNVLLSMSSSWPANELLLTLNVKVTSLPQALSDFTTFLTSQPTYKTELTHICICSWNKWIKGWMDGQKWEERD